MDQIAEQSAWRITVSLRSSGWLQLHKGVPSSYPALELRFEWIEFFVFLMPHGFHIANRAGVVEEQQKVLEKFQIFLKFPL